MDNSMMKRGIGAVVLAVIAALLLGYLLKGKSTERQDVVDMKLPGAPEMNIPSLSEAGNSATALVDGATDKVVGAGSAVITAAGGAATTAKDTVIDSAKAAGNNAKAAIIVSSDKNTKSAENPGFSIRPSQQNEQREVVDTKTKTSTNKKPSSKDTVVASNKEKAFKPRIVEEKKKPAKKVVKKTIKKEIVKKTVVKNTPPVKKVVKQAVAKAPVATTTKPKKAAPVVASAGPSGAYSIQLLATSSTSRASKLATVMKSEGYSSFITKANNGSKILYRVRVGGYNNRNSAIKAQDTMKRRYQKNFFVQNSLVVSK